MEIGIVGLGRMGGNIARRLMKAGHRTVGYDRSDEAVMGATKDGAQGGSGLKDLVGKLKPPRAIWLMLPAGEITESAVTELAGLLERGDILIDGGNTFYKDDI